MKRRDFIFSGGGALVVAFALPLSGALSALAAADGVFSSFPAFTPPPDSVDAWLEVDSEGNIRVFTGKVELGTGVRTALSQLVADELDVPFSSVHMIMGDTERCPDQGPTVGSLTIFLAGPQLRKAAAEAKRALFELAAKQWKSPIDKLTANQGQVFAADGRQVSYGKLVGGKRFDRRISKDVSLKKPSEMNLIGKPVKRVELADKVCGIHDFIHDLKMPEALHGRIIRSPQPGARLKSINLDKLKPFGNTVQVVRKGSILGLVSANEVTLNKALESIEAQWETVSTPSDELDLGRAYREIPSTDDIVQSTGKAFPNNKRDDIFQAGYEVPHQLHASIGPSCAVADVKPDRATVWCGTQMSFPLRDTIAVLLGLNKEKVRVIWTEGSGCYGQNGNDDCSADAALLSQMAGKPVRVQWSRSDEHFFEPRGPAMRMSVRAILSEQSRIAFWHYEVWSPTHTNCRPLGAGNLLIGSELGLPKRLLKVGAERNAKTSYVIPNHKVVVHNLHSSLVRTSSFRALGAPGNTFANESFVDEICVSTGADPLAFRKDNLSDVRAIAVLDEVARLCGWKKAEKNQPNGRGRGLAFVQYHNSSAYVAMVMDVRVDLSNGHIQVLDVYVAHDCGLIVNPDGLRNQIEGNVIQGLSRALYEDAGSVSGVHGPRDWATYPIMRFSGLPDAIHISLLDRPSEISVGAGEPATVPVFACLANAVYQAAGVRIRSIPVTPEKISSALKSAL